MSGTRITEKTVIRVKIQGEYGTGKSIYINEVQSYSPWIGYTSIENIINIMERNIKVSIYNKKYKDFVYNMIKTYNVGVSHLKDNVDIYGIEVVSSFEKAVLAEHQMDHEMYKEEPDFFNPFLVPRINILKNNIRNTIISVNSFNQNEKKIIQYMKEKRELLLNPHINTLKITVGLSDSVDKNIFFENVELSCIE